ncbi:MAG: molybdopterin-dependent oxidoreductase [Deltaproteobacteria bacterium]|nr:molybdopterin-dependent oxidoreductase [Deltaproteobacteria bacterium]
MKSNGKNITELLAINRRNFIKLAVGGAVGTGLSPLPWKLIDDTAIFTQNFPWVPVPEEGEFTTVKSHCTLCPGGCGIEVRKVGDRAVKIEGRTDHPINPGGICPLGMGGLQLLYNENNRFTGPMKRIGSRGDGKFEPISWGEALKTLTHRILELRNKGKANYIVAVDGNRTESTMSLMIERFMKSLGSNNYMRVPSSEDTSAIVSGLMYGSDAPVSYDIENSDFILSFGCGLLEGWGAPGRVLNAWGIWRSEENRAKVTIMQVESRASNTASKADKWLPAKPGTEAALALGMANIIIKENLYDKDFIDNKTFGFFAHEGYKGFKDLVLDSYTPEKVSKITGIKPDDIAVAARAFAKAESPVAICGKGKGLLSGDVFEFMAVHALNALTGNINKPGGVFVSAPLPLTPLPEVEVDDLASESLKEPCLSSKRFRLNRYCSQLNVLTDSILMDQEQAVDTLLVFSSNPAFTLPDGGDFYQSLKKIPFIVSFSPYLDETTLMADIILPDHTYLEKIDDILNPPALQYNFYGLTQPVIDPLYNTKNSGDVLLDLAEMIGGSVKNSFPWKSYEEVLKARVTGLHESGEGLLGFTPSTAPWKLIKNNIKVETDLASFEDMWERLKNGGIWYNPTSHIKSGANLFNTESGKFEFFSSRLKSAIEASSEKPLLSDSEGILFMPHFEPDEKKQGTDSLRMVPYELINLSNGWIPSPPYLYKTLFDSQLLKNDSFVELNPETAGKFGLKEGDSISITSEKGSVQARVHIFEGAMPDVVYMPMGFGHTAFDDFIRGKGCNPNSLMGARIDPLSGQPAWWNTPVRIKKVYI